MNIKSSNGVVAIAVFFFYIITAFFLFMLFYCLDEKIRAKVALNSKIITIFAISYVIIGEYNYGKR